MSDDFDKPPESGSWAADDPTAMWNQESLEEAGVVFEQKSSAAATSPDGPLVSSMQIDLTQNASNPPPAAAAGGMSLKLIVITGVLSVALAVAVFFLVKMLRS